eukprot:288929_1
MKKQQQASNTQRRRSYRSLIYPITRIIKNSDYLDPESQNVSEVTGYDDKYYDDYDDQNYHSRGNQNSLDNMLSEQKSNDNTIWIEIQANDQYHRA